jgi:NAD-reducing hydrogenase large subunit
MTQRITIEPVTRIEGHARITLHLDDSGAVEAARFHVTQLRGFEKLCEGRPFYEMPSLMARICGICPVSHLLASAKACDAIMAVRIPETAVKLRRLLNLAQVVQSHALSFFYLSAPDLLFGMDGPPLQRHLFGVAQADPALARDGIRLRQFGQQVIESFAGKRIHPAWVVAGGVVQPLSAEQRDRIREAIPEVVSVAERSIAWFKGQLSRFADEIEAFGRFPSLFMSMVDDDGGLEHYDGKLRIVDSNRAMIAEGLEPPDYQNFIAEAVEPWSYLKFPYYKPSGYPGGMYRVGPLARLNVAARCGTPRAERELAEFRALEEGAVLGSFHYHYARLIEILYALERMDQLLGDPEILNPRVRSSAGVNQFEGIGAAEAPRGTLIHHYKVDTNGLVTWANLIIATGHNNLAMNRGILQAARRFVRGKELSEGMLNRVEAVIRSFDPCLSCSTHAVGQMPLRIELIDGNGALVNAVERG